jgi:adenosylhomocysteine nucleosidase
MIGIISAMEEEIQTLLRHLGNKRSIEKGMRTYFYGRLLDKEIVLAYSRWGKVASAITAAQMINDFDIKEVIFTGVAGSMSRNINIGDIVIGKNMYQYDMNAWPLIEPLEIPLLGKTFFETNVLKRKLLNEAADHFLANFSSHIKIEEVKKFNIESPMVHIADIASGDQFVSEKQQIRSIKQVVPSVGCVEMEGAAVAQVCYEYQIPFSIFRIISDKADDNAHVVFQKFAKQVASKYALGILRNYFKLIE